MLSGLRILMLGGDARQLEIAKSFAEWDASIMAYLFEQAIDALPDSVRFLTDEQLSDAFANVDVIMLPALSCDDHACINSSFSNVSFQLTDEWLEQIHKHTVIFTGVAHSAFRKRCQSRSIRLIELFERDDVAIYNSIPTAEGAVMMAIEMTKITIHHSKIVVLGMGRTGFTLARMLQAMGAYVRVGVRRPEQFARAFEMGWNPFFIEELHQNVSEIDLLFNTIPTMIVTAQIIVRMPNSAVLIDLASKPGGIDFRFAEKRGIQARLAPGLPGIVAPITAGKILANVMHHWLTESLEQSGGRI